MKISLVVVADENNGIGKNNQLLCHLPADLRYFKNLTTGHHILMGRKTFESIGKPLANRTNIVISRSTDDLPGCLVFDSLEKGITYAKANKEDQLFVIGGATIFEQCMEQTDRIYLTRIHHRFEADTFFPSLNEDEWNMTMKEPHEADEKNKYPYTFEILEKKV